MNKPYITGMNVMHIRISIYSFLSSFLTPDTRLPGCMLNNSIIQSYLTSRNIGDGFDGSNRYYMLQ